MEEVRAFLDATPETQLAVIDVSFGGATPCIRIFPAVLALAKNFQGYASFARLLADKMPGDFQSELASMGILEVPTFLFFRG